MKKPRVEFPVYVPPETQQNYDQATSIEDIEDQMDDWLQDAKAPKKKVRRDRRSLETAVLSLSLCLSEELLQHFGAHVYGAAPVPGLQCIPSLLSRSPGGQRTT